MQIETDGLSIEERAELETARSFIESVPMFHGLAEPNFLNALARVLTATSFPANAYVVEKGQVGQEMYFIRSGFVEMLPDQDSPAFGQKGPGAFFGEMALLNAEPRNAYIRCLQEINVFVLAKSNLQKVLLDFPDLEAVIRKPIMERETERAKEIGDVLANVRSSMSRKEKRDRAATRIQRSSKRFLVRVREQRSMREALAAQANAAMDQSDLNSVDWEHLASGRESSRRISFGADAGVEDEVWIDYNADMLAWEEVLPDVQFSMRLQSNSQIISTVM